MNNPTNPGFNPTTYNDLFQQASDGLVLLPPPVPSGGNITINQNFTFQCINISAPFDSVALERLLDEREREQWRDIVNLYPGRYC